MSPFTSRLLELLPLYGPWLLFALAVLETCFVTGLVVPSGLATSLATVLALDGSMDLPAVLAAAAVGGAVGDSLGYWIGRVTGERVLAEGSRWSRVLVRKHSGVRRFFGRHPVYSVTLARLVSFVRTVMPMAAGMSGIRYTTFLAYESLGLLGWVMLYMGIGVLARESWELATQVVGVGGAVAFCVVGAFLWVEVRRRQGRRHPRVPEDGEVL